ncbi:XK-related protein 6 [Halocaridina rubra]|uniref:XK-related protein n=1 Tax=Halocaridina rubra TaxID=373956 RepID=A0AAN9AFU3_HALRR
MGNPTVAMAVTSDGNSSSFNQKFRDSQELQDLPPRTDGRVIVFKMPTFTVFDGTFMALSMVTYVVDIGTDLNLVVRYCMVNSIIWASLTLSLVLFPAIIVMILSLRWHIADGHPVTKMYWLAHVFLWGIFHRYILMFRSGVKARQSQDLMDYDELYRQQNDVCMLRMFESFMESAPQLVLQLYIMMSYHDYTAWTAITAFTSMVSLGWSIAAYTKAMRNARLDKHKMTIAGLTLQTLWRVGMIAARVASLALVATVLEGWLFLILGLHVIATFIWVVKQKTGFSSTLWEEHIFNFIMAVTYCFCFFNLKEGHSRWRMFAFYSVVVLENSLFVLLYYFLGHHEKWIKYTSLGVVFGGMILGLMCMVLYYRYFHPVGPLNPFKKWFSYQEHDPKKQGKEPQTLQDSPTSGISDNTSKISKRLSLRRNIKSLYPFVPKDSTCILSAHGVSLKSSPASAAAETISSSQLTYNKPAEVMCSVQDLLANVSCSSSDPEQCESVNDNDISGSQLPCVKDENETSPSSFERSIARELDVRLSSSDFRGGYGVEEILDSNDDGKHSDSTRSTTSQQSPETISGNLATQSSPNSVGIPPKSKNSTSSNIVRRDMSGTSILRTSVKRKGITSSSDMRITSLPHLSESYVNDTSQPSEEDALELVENSNNLKPPNVELAVIDKMHIIEVESSGLSSENQSDLESAFDDKENLSRNLPPKPVNLVVQNLDESQTTQSSVPHDYENICAVNINRAMLGVRHWKTYSDIEDRIHDNSTFKERLKLLDSTLASSHSSEYSNLKSLLARRSISMMEDCDSVLSRSLPDLSALRLETCIEEPEVEQEDENAEGAVKDDQRLMAALNQLRANKPINKSNSVDDIPNYETIWVGEVEKPETSDTSSQMNSVMSKSSLVVTIGDVRAKESLCNLYYSTMSDLSFRYYSERMRNNCSVHSRTSRRSIRDNTREMMRAISVPDNKTLLEVSEIMEEQRREEREKFHNVKDREIPPGNENDRCTVTHGETPVGAGGQDRPRRKFSMLRERFEHPWTPLKSPMKRGQPAQRRNSLQERTAKALQAGMKVFRRPRVHVITPKKSEDKDTPRLKSPFRSKTTTPTTPAIKIHSDPVDTKISKKNETEGFKVAVHRTPQNRDIGFHRQIKNTPKTSTPENVNPTSAKKTPSLVLDASKVSHLKEGPKTSTPEGNKQLQQMSILSAVSSVVPSPEALQRTNPFNQSVRRPLSENLRHDISNKRTHSSQLLKGPQITNSALVKEPTKLSFSTAKSVSNLKISKVNNNLENVQNMSNIHRTSRLGMQTSQSLLCLQTLQTSQHFPVAGASIPGSQLQVSTRSAVNIVESVSNPSSHQNVSISRIILASPQSPNFSLQKSTLSPNSKIFSRRI